ncbi:MAG: hypothetical protein M3250_05875 [Thermoproteota archaeon]|nr:hypothetical protein [Thermoproteota archaeon]
MIDPARSYHLRDDNNPNIQGFDAPVITVGHIVTIREQISCKLNHGKNNK